MAIVCRVAFGRAPRALRVWDLNSIDNLGLVELVHRRSVGPRQPIGPCVQAGGEDHRLAHTRGSGVGEQLVEPAGAHGHALSRPPHVELGVDVLHLDLAVERPDEEVQSNGAHQRLGERVVDQALPV